MSKSKIEKVLTEIYYDPLEGLMGINSLYKKAKKVIKTIKLKDVQSWYKKQATTQVHYRQTKKINYLPIFSYRPGAFQMDLTEMKRLASKNKQYKYILTAINVNTRKLYAYKSKSKSAATIKKLLNQFKKDVRDHNLNIPENNRPPEPYVSSITTDAGTEFIGSKSWFIDNDIQLIVVNPMNKKYTTSKIERVHRTLKELFNKYFTAFATSKWYDMLDDFIANYNNRFHYSIKQSPNDVGYKEEKDIIKNDFLRMVKKLNTKQYQVGDKVRIRNVKRMFEKGEVLYSSKVYTVDKIYPLFTYRLRDEDGDLLKKTFKDYEMLYVGEDIQNAERVSRASVEEADRQASSRNRFLRTGLDRSTIRSDQLRASRRIGNIMRPKRKKKVKRLQWKYKRGDKIRAELRFFRGTNLSNKVRIGKIQQTNSKFQGNIPAYNIKWNDQDTGLWYDKESVESELVDKN